MSQFTALTIKEIIQETPSAVSLVFNIPEEVRSDFQFISGQFITLKTKINGNEIRRAYSISSNPADIDIKVSVKKIANGAFSVYANEHLKVGDTLEAMVPEGKFKLEPQPNKSLNYIAFAAGSGITPIMSMIKTVLTQETKSTFTLIYGNKTANETMFFKELLELQTQYSDRLFIEFVYSRENAENAKFGRIDKSTINYALKSKFSDVSFNHYYLCGPKAMIDTVQEVLSENKIPKEHIHFELFTSTSTTSTNIVTEGGAAIAAVILDDDEVSIEVDKKITLLDSVLKEGLEAPYSCKGGVCCSCICRVVEGDVTMPVNNLLTDSEVAEGLVLACQAYAVSDHIKIDFDNA